MNPNKRCPFYEEELYEGKVAEAFCNNPDISVDGRFVCPFGEEYDCDIPIHQRNLKRLI